MAAAQAEYDAEVAGQGSSAPPGGTGVTSAAPGVSVVAPSSSVVASIAPASGIAQVQLTSSGGQAATQPAASVITSGSTGTPSTGGAVTTAALAQPAFSPAPSSTTPPAPPVGAITGTTKRVILDATQILTALNIVKTPPITATHFIVAVINQLYRDIMIGKPAGTRLPFSLYKKNGGLITSPNNATTLITELEAHASNGCYEADENTYMNKTVLKMA